MKILFLFLATLVLSGCDDASNGPGDALVADTSLVVAADPELRDMAARLLPGLAARAGLTLVAPVRIERRSRDELETYLLAKLDDELPPERADALARSYALLGLVPEDTDLRALLLAVYREQVAGFYDPDSTALFVLDDQPATALEPLLLHELVHAVQDQAVDLEALTSRELDNDRRTAAQAAIEGHATLVMLEFMTGEGSGVDLATVPGIADQLRPALEEARTRYPALAAAPRVVQEGLLFPYLEGAGYVLAAWREDPDRGRVLGTLLPHSTEQVLDPKRSLGEVPDPPLTVMLSLPDGEVRLDEVLGQAELRILLEGLGLDPVHADGWGGDRHALIVPAGGGEPGLVFAVAWDSVAARDAFVVALSEALDRFPRPARVEAVDAAGHPVSLLRIEHAGDVAVTVGEGR